MGDRERCAEMKKYDNSTNMTVESAPKVRIDPAIQFMRDGVVVGEVSAVYDFSKCPSEFHYLGIQLIQTHCSRVALPVFDPPRPPTMTEAETKAGSRKSWWGWLGDWF